MKTIILSTLSLFLFGTIWSQEESKTTKKIETIKIIDGDTVVHDVREVDGEFKHRHRMHHDMHFEDMEELSDLLEEVDIYISADDAHKKMIVKKLHRNEVEMDSILKTLEVDEDIVIDYDKSDRKVKVIKIEIDETDGEEVTVVEMKGGKGHREERIETRRHSKDDKTGDVKVFPNPASEEFNLHVNVKEANTIVKVVDDKGKMIFEKEYKELGKYEEQISLKKNQNGMIVVTLESPSTGITKKLMVE